MGEKGDFREVLLWPTCIDPFAEVGNTQCKEFEFFNLLLKLTYIKTFLGRCTVL